MNENLGEGGDDDKRKLAFAAYIGIRFFVFMLVLFAAMVIIEKC